MNCVKCGTNKISDENLRKWGDVCFPCRYTKECSRCFSPIEKSQYERNQLCYKCTKDRDYPKWNKSFFDAKISAAGLNQDQKREFDCRMKALVLSHLLKLPPARNYEWMEALQNIEYWEPRLKKFGDRMDKVVKGMLANERPKLTTDKEEGYEPHGCDAMRCMVRGCADGRSRPYVHHMKWWKNKEEFETIWKLIQPDLKDVYLGDQWRSRIKEYGTYVCLKHYKMLFRLLHSEYKGKLPCESSYYQENSRLTEGGAFLPKIISKNY